jgi:hypothetical protein
MEKQPGTATFVFEQIVVVLTQFLFFIFGWFFFRAKLFKDYEVKRTAVQIYFSLMFALSCTLFELVIFEIIDLFSKQYCDSNFHRLT